MDIINPIKWQDSMLVSSTAVDTTVALWSSATAYAVGERARLDTTHKVYECLIAHTNASPDTNTSGATPKWLEVGATNVYAMVDNKWGTQTTATSSLVIKVKPGVPINSLALLNLKGSSVTITSTCAGMPDYSKTIPLISDVGVYDWLTYFTAPIVAEDDVVVKDLMPYANQEITITITGTGTVAIGSLVMGSYVELGKTMVGATVSIIDYSTKSTDAYGNITVVARAYAKRCSVKLEVDSSFSDQLHGILSSIRSTPVVWVGFGSTFASLIVYGYYKDFDIVMDYYNTHTCSLTIEGLI